MMLPLPRFNYHKPSSLKEALELLERLEDARPLAGGTDLIVDMKIGRCKPKHVVDIGGLKELRYIEDNGWVLRIGALTTIQEILESPVVSLKAPLLRMVAEKFAYWQIRNVATIGGNLCNASPAADMAVPLLVYNAQLKIVSLSGERYVPITEFFKGPRKTALGKGELLVEVLVPYRDLEGYGTAYAKIGRRRGHDISLVSASVAIKLHGGFIADARIALNSVAPTPLRARGVEDRLKGARPSAEVFEEASKLVVNDISPISDIRAPADYRAHLSVVLVRDLLFEAYRAAFKGGLD